MEQHALINVNICLNTNIYFYFETSGGQSSILYLNIAHFYSAVLFSTEPRLAWAHNSLYFVIMCIFKGR